FQYNRDLNRATAIEERFEAGLKAIVPQPVERTKFIVRMAPGVWHNSDSLSDIYVQTFYGSRLVNMRVLQPGAPVTKWEDYSTVIFGPDDKGVQMSDSGGTAPLTIPYSQVRIVSFDGDNVVLMGSVAPSDLVGFRVGFDRPEPIHQGAQAAAAAQAAPRAPLCTYAADFTEPLSGVGWSVPERTPDGRIAFTWMAADVATLNAKLPCDRPTSVTFRVVQAMSSDILDQLGLEVDGERISLTRVNDAQGATVFTGVVSEQAMRSANGEHVLRLEAPRTIVPAGGDRTLAVALDTLQLRPATGSNGT
ncbi:MAG TPA: hypothetical protein VKV73_24240, partial [Chloroflexota bacterium]|nr:hypothetical protein [Chloroflexota bacterium]